METKYHEVPLERVMQFYADHFEAGGLVRTFDGSHVWAEWFIDTQRERVVYKLMTAK